MVGVVLTLGGWGGVCMVGVVLTLGGRGGVYGRGSSYLRG